jgi:hypothetical protein
MVLPNIWAAKLLLGHAWLLNIKMSILFTLKNIDRCRFSRQWRISNGKVTKNCNILTWNLELISCENILQFTNTTYSFHSKAKYPYHIEYKRSSVFAKKSRKNCFQQWLFCYLFSFFCTQMAFMIIVISFIFRKMTFARCFYISIPLIASHAARLFFWHIH